MPATYLLTGAAGFIGARVAALLLDAGHQVLAFDNLNDAYDVRVKHYRLDRLLSHPGFTFNKLDISEKNALRQGVNAAMAEAGATAIDAVINLAARAGVRQSVENPWVYVDTNVTGTLNLLELSHDLQIKKFILASTSSVYGANAPLPTPETADSNHPLQVYAATKKSAETLCHVYHHLYGIDVTVVRYFTVYGPAGRPDMSMFRFVQWISENKPVKIFGDGEQMRGFTHVDDIARGTLLGLQPLGYEVINLGGHETIRMNQLVAACENLIGKKANVQYFPADPADMLANWADVSKAKRLLGWEPQVSLQAGLTGLVDWYLAERNFTSTIQTG
jgi:nucleoside-diphosphate-sugar epimerase